MPAQSVNLDIQMLDLYSDYLISSFSYTTATGMSSMLSGSITHDQVTRFLSSADFSSRDLWRLVKPTIREIKCPDGCLVFDDTVEEKLYTDENDIIAWHFDHTFGRNIKGVNILNCTYVSPVATIPLAFDIVKKTTVVTDPKTGKTKRLADVSKNTMFRSMFDQVVKNQVKFQHVLADIWFSSVKNMEHIMTAKKQFIFPVKSNRLVALSPKDKRDGKFQTIESLSLKPGTVYRGYLNGLGTEVSLARQVFTNGDGSTGVLYLVTSDAALDFAALTTLYHKRWKVEEFHKSIKSNTLLSKSPTKTVRTQTNHFFASIYSNFKLELLKMKTKKNHWALKAQLYLTAIQASYAELTKLRAESLVLKSA